MKRKTKFIICTITAFIIISNLPPIAFFFQENYSYQNKDGSFKFQEQSGKSLDFEVCKIRFDRFKKLNPSNDQVLYRNFTIKPWRFWEWWQMVAHSERFTLPYNSKTNS